MPANIEGSKVESVPSRIYDERVEARLGALEKEVAVMQNNFATKDDLHALRMEMHAGFERINTAFYSQRQEVRAEIDKLREEVMVALSNQRIDFNTALSNQRIDFNTALSNQRKEFLAALAHRREEVQAAPAHQREVFKTPVANQAIDLRKSVASQTWKICGAISLMVAGVYFIARYVH